MKVWKQSYGDLTLTKAEPWRSEPDTTHPVTLILTNAL